MLVKRTISSVALIALAVASVFIEALFGVVVTLFIILGLYEFFTMVENKGINIYKYFGITMGAIIPLSIFFKFEPTRTWELLFIVLALLSLIMMQLKRRESVGTVVGISVTIFGILYISWFFSFLLKIRQLCGGIWFLGLVLMVTKLNDIGAYLVGSRFGKTPLLPRISPKKSVEGSVGGMVFGILSALAFKSVLPFSYSHLIFIGAVLGILGQIGDLSESLMKRDCQVKDSANIIPGIGGILDLIDSLLFTAPVFYFYLSIIL